MLLAELQKSGYFQLSGEDEEGEPIVLQDLIKLDDGTNDAIWAYNFELTLPLNEPVVIE